MGLWEKDVFKVADCPCGKGAIQRVIESPDGPWSRPHTSYELDCTDCSAKWDMSPYGTLTERASEGEYRAASNACSKAATALQVYLESLLAEFSFPPFKRLSDEFAFLLEQGLYHETFGKYRHARRTREMRNLAAVRPTSVIVPRLVEQHGDNVQYRALAAAAKSAADVAATKYEAIKHLHFS